MELSVTFFPGVQANAKPASKALASDLAAEKARALYVAHARFVLAMLRRYGIQENDLADSLQDVFIVVQQRIHTLESDAVARSWLYGIARRVASDQRKKNARRERPAESSEFEKADARSEKKSSFEQSDLRAILLDSMNMLSEDFREVLVLIDVEGWSVQEVSLALEIPDKTVYGRLYSAREKMRASLLRKGVTP